MKCIKESVWEELFEADSDKSAFKIFGSLFIEPITVGQYLESTNEQFESLLHRSYVLNDLLKPYIHRKNGLDLVGMPEKRECVLYVCLTELQRKLYAVNYLFLFFMFLNFMLYFNYFRRLSLRKLRLQRTQKNLQC